MDTLNSDNNTDKMGQKLAVIKKRKSKKEIEAAKKLSRLERAEKTILVQLKTDSGEFIGSKFSMPLNITSDKLQILCNMLKNKEEQTTYSFFVEDGSDIIDELADSLPSDLSYEAGINVICQAEAPFTVQPITRCTGTMEGHAEAILDVQFSPDSRHFASGSGDTTVRFWDIQTETPLFTCKGHSHWVLFIAWSPCARKLASGCKNGLILIWDPNTGKQIGKTLKGHLKWIMSLAWKPLHLDGSSRFLASSSKDGTIRIWDVVLSICIRILSGHMQSVTCVRWSGENLIYSSSQDRSIKVWQPDTGILCRTLEGHGHWVNHLALNTDYILRTGVFDPIDATLVPDKLKLTDEQFKERASTRYSKFTSSMSEKMVSCSDDHTMSLWSPTSDKKSICRLSGHQQPINEAVFSPDGRLLASASFDKSIKLWNGISGKFLGTLRGHIQEVYQVVWTSDSRLLISASADSTIKLWNVKTQKLLYDLPGHADQVFALDWSPDGQRVISGGKDKVLKVWRR